MFYALSVGQALLFIVVHQALFGLYTGLVFAPNHKGMPILDSDSQLDFVRRQVLTSRDVNAHPLTDFWYGGLNYQIEHHLFPSMPRNKLKKLRPSSEPSAKRVPFPIVRAARCSPTERSSSTCIR